MEMHIRDIQFQQRIREYLPGDAAGCRLHYIVGGRGRLSCAAGRFPVHGGSFMIMRPDEQYRLSSSSRGSFISQYMVATDGHGGIGDLPSALPGGVRIFDIGASGRSFFEQLRLKHASGNPLLREAARHQLLSFLLGLAGMGHAEMAPGDSHHIETALRLMQENIRRRLGLEDIATQVGLNKSYFVRLFRRRLGMAPMRYFNELKINAACHLLLDTDMTVAEISAHLGFAEEFYFSRCFKKFKGVSPAGFRRCPVNSGPGLMAVSA